MSATTSSTTLSAFLDACSKQDCSLVSQLLDAAASEGLLDSTDPRAASGLTVQRPEFSRTPLLHLLYRRCEDAPELVPPLVQRLLDAKVDVNAQDASGKTALHYSAGQIPTGDYSRRNPAVVQLLMQAGADVHAVDHGGWTPLHEACRNLDDKDETCMAVVEHLLSAKADLQAVDQNNGDTPLHCCLVERDPMFSTDFHWKLEFPTLTAFLIDQGADATQASKDGIKPLDCVEAALTKEMDDDGTGAASGGLDQRISFLCQVVPALVRQGVAPGLVVDKQAIIGGRMLLTVMQQFNGDNEEDLVEQHVDPLLEFGANVNHADQNGCTALHYLLLNRYLDEELWVDEGGHDAFVLSVIDRLVAKAPALDLRAVDNNGRSLLDCARDADYPSVCARLESKRARVDDSSTTVRPS